MTDEYNAEYKSTISGIGSGSVYICKPCFQFAQYVTSVLQLCYSFYQDKQLVLNISYLGRSLCIIFYVSQKNINCTHHYF